MRAIQKITSNLWFDTQAEQAARLYASVFRNSQIGTIARYGKAGHDTHGMTEGSVMTIEFWIEGQKFLGLNGGPAFKFNEAISFIINCDNQEEIDYYWEKLSAGGDPAAQQCGWLKDKFGVSWQVVPAMMDALMQGEQEKADKVMTAMLQMKKPDIKTLQDAYNN